MADEVKKVNIEKLPNSISGDGKNFVMQLKKSLKDLEVAVNEVNDKVEDVEQGQPTEAEQVTNLQLSEENTSDTNGMPQNNIVVTFDSSEVTDFKNANIWLSSNAGAKYQQAGSTNGNTFTIKDVDVGTTYYVKVTAVNKTLGESNFDTAPQASITIKGNPIIPEKPTQFFLTWDEEGPLWKWLYNENNYIDFFELRLDANAGVYDDNLLDRTRNSFSRANPKIRSGTAYLFVRNIFGDYSEPATHVFNKVIAGKPNPPTIIQLLHGIDIKMDPLPEGYQGYEIVIDGTDVYTTHNNIFTYYQVSGTVTIKYCFYDTIGKGEYSDEITVEIKTVIDDIEVPTIDYDKFDDAVKDAIDKANAQADINDAINSAIAQNKDSITAVVTELNKPPEECSYSAITVLKDGIDLSVKEDEIISRINLSKEGITIDGRVLHITGDTVIDGRVIIGSNIKEGSIDGTTIADGAITSGKIGAGAVGQVAIADGAVIADKIAANAITSAKINANAITADKIQAGAITSEKIEADAITAEKIAAEAITSEAIQANSIIGQHISAGAITTDKLAAGDITMSGELAMVGGTVRLSEDGLKCSMDNGEYVTFNQFGMMFFDANGNAFSQISKMLIGQAKHGQRVNFSVPWTTTPNVMTSPTDIQVMDITYPSSNLSLRCRPINIDNTGFEIECCTVLGADSGGSIAYGKQLNANARYEKSNANYYSPPVSEDVPIPETATYINLHLTCFMKIEAAYEFDSDSSWFHDGIFVCNVAVDINGEEVLNKDVQVTVNGVSDNPHPSDVPTANTQHNINCPASIKKGSKVTVRFKPTRVYGTGSATLTIVSYEANVSEDVVISTGTANFIVTENNTGYTITNS